MIYVMSDIHGCFKEYKKALESIDFKEEDLLYVLGDVIDRGEDSLSILFDMMNRINVYPILGNHEYMAKVVLNKLAVEIKEDNVENYLNEEDMMNYLQWMSNGGYSTVKQFLALTKEKQEMILEYLDEFSLYETIQVNDKNYILVHAGLEPFDKNKALKDYQVHELIFKSPSLDQVYFEDDYVIVGHTPTLLLEEPYKGRIFKHNKIISIDGGCVFNGNLAIYCLDNEKEYYIKKV